MADPRADPADLIVEHATVVTVDARQPVINDARIAVVAGRIASIGRSGDPATRPAATRVLDVRGSIVLPGLVNAHTHLTMTLFRGLADDRDLDGFLARMLPAEAEVLSADTVEAGTALAVAESLLAGITSANDMYFFPEASHAVARAAGFRLHSGPVFIEFPGPDSRVFDRRLAWAEEYLASNARGPGSSTWVAPHSTYLLSKEQLTQVAALAERHGARVHVHACETRAEIEQVADRHGCTPIEVLAEVGLLGSRTVLAHGVHLSDQDIALIADAGASVVHCPASNLKLASGIARVADLLDAGVNVALGTDGTASGNDLDLWLAGRLAAYVAKGISGDATRIPASTVVEMLTLNGAKALGRDHELGSIEVGKRADLVVLDPGSPALTPSYSPTSTVAYAAARRDVRWVIVDGDVVVDDRRLTGIDVDAAIRRVRELQPTVESAVPT